MVGRRYLCFLLSYLTVWGSTKGQCSHRWQNTVPLLVRRTTLIVQTRSHYRSILDVWTLFSKHTFSFPNSQGEGDLIIPFFKNWHLTHNLLNTLCNALLDDFCLFREVCGHQSCSLPSHLVSMFSHFSSPHSPSGENLPICMLSLTVYLIWKLCSQNHSITCPGCLLSLKTITSSHCGMDHHAIPSHGCIAVVCWQMFGLFLFGLPWLAPLYRFVCNFAGRWF